MSSSIHVYAYLGLAAFSGTGGVVEEEPQFRCLPF
jgi:hypothetical protein